MLIPYEGRKLRMIPARPADFFRDSLLSRFFDEDGEGETYFGKHVGADMYEENGKFFVEMDLPGIRIEEARIECGEKSLYISYKTPENQEPEGRKYYDKRTRNASFEYARSFPENVDPESCSASYENGVLKISVSRAEKKNAVKIEVKPEKRISEQS